jgi:hypothetical protein
MGHGPRHVIGRPSLPAGLHAVLTIRVRLRRVPAAARILGVPDEPTEVDDYLARSQAHGGLIDADSIRTLDPRLGCERDIGAGPVCRLGAAQ